MRVVSRFACASLLLAFSLVAWASKSDDRVDAEVRVGAIPEESASVRIEPQAPIHRNDLQCIVNAPSIEMPGGISIAWEVERPGLSAAELIVVPESATNTVSWKLTAAGDRWTCTATWPRGLVLESRVKIEQGPPGGNVLLVLLDDVGVDKIGVYGEHPKPPPTPTIDALAADGLLFRNAYAYPTCSPTRAALLTGRYARRTGIGSNLGKIARLAPEEVGLAEVVAQSAAYDYSKSMVGKWHLAGVSTPDWLMHPAAFGFDWFSVAMLNLSSPQTGDRLPGYTNWTVNQNGVAKHETTYATTHQVDTAISRIKAMPEPWFLFLSFSAPHVPKHHPPSSLHSYDLSKKPDHVMYNATMEALDTELGRLLASIDPEVLADTTIIVMGDNGTPDFASRGLFKSNQAKGTLYDGGTHVPMVIKSPLVRAPGSEVSAFVHIVDIFPTLAEIAGADIGKLFASQSGPGSLADWPIDGKSLVPLLHDPDLAGRKLIYTEAFFPNGVALPRTRDKRSVRNQRWRYTRDIDGGEELFNLTTHYPNSGPNLLGFPLSPEAALAREKLAFNLDQVIEQLGD